MEYCPTISNTLAFQTVQEPCRYEKDTVYVAVFNWECNKNEIKPLMDALKDLPWYNPAVIQTLWSDWAWNILRS